MSQRNFFGRQVQVTVRALFALAFLMLASGAAGVIVYFMGDRSPGNQREAAPSPAESEPVVASSYEAVIRPLLDARCAACHGEKKQKAGLSLATAETIAAGGKHGPAVIPSAPATSLMLQRVELALDHDKHMPPDDQDQLTAGERAALKCWILAGAPFEGVVEGVRLDGAGATASEAGPGDRSSSEIVHAAPAAIAALRAALVHVQPISQGSPLLWVDFAAVAKTADDVTVRELLAPVSAQLCDLSLSRSGVGDGTLALLAGFPNLRRLDVRATAVGDPGVAALAHHAKLAELVLAQTTLSDAAVDNLIAMPALQRVHLWRSGVSDDALARLKLARPKLRVDDGATPDSAALEVETAIALTKAPAALPAVSSTTASPSLAPVNSKCPVTGAPVKPQFAVVHEGRVIGFCCSQCPSEFWADPAKFAERLN